MTQTAEAPPKGARRGSSFSDRQIAQTVKDGTAVRVTTLGDDGPESITGWVFGMDDFHWGIVDGHGNKYLVHKTAPSLQIVDYPTLGTYAEKRDEIEALVEPFRRSVLRNHFGQND
jgi:hypothetical protein